MSRYSCVFLEKRPLLITFSNFCSESFHRDTIDVLCSNFVKFGRREIVEIVHCLPDKKKILPGSPAVATARIAPKICQSQPPTMYSESCFRFHPNRFTFGGVIAERVNTAKTTPTLNPIIGWSLASSRIMICIFVYAKVTYSGVSLAACVLQLQWWLEVPVYAIYTVCITACRNYIQLDFRGFLRYWVRKHYSV